jgi:putative Holliday junction resolvase
VRILAVDPGKRYLGLAISDPSGTVARPLATLSHQSRVRDAERIAAAAEAEAAELIVIGYALNSEGEPGPQARHAERLAAAVKALTGRPVRLHDESFSSLAADEAMRTAGRRRKARRAEIHAVAAAAILQSFLDANQSQAPPG